MGKTNNSTMTSWTKGRKWSENDLENGWGDASSDAIRKGTGWGVGEFERKANAEFPGADLNWIPQTGEVIGRADYQTDNDPDERLEEIRDAAMESMWQKYCNGDFGDAE